METARPDARELLMRRSSAFSGVIGPDGRTVGEPLIDDEGIVYADIDLNRCIQPKQMHDIIGHYNRFDVFDLRVNRAAALAALLERRWRADAGNAASRRRSPAAAAGSTAMDMA